MSAKNSTKTGVKFPRVIVSGSRHAKLSAAAKKKGISLQEHAEKIFKRAER